ncbi:MAG: outer membrane lipoprotein-sorting protein [Acidobacteriota bacterium]|nr:outer membrane lipoprotein-sorting protein [Acidobacteriota bacterium]
MRNLFKIWMRVLLTGVMTLALVPHASARKSKHHTDLTVSQILAHMNAQSKSLKTISAKLEYTKVTVLVDDKSTESGQLYFRRGKTTDIRIDFDKPERKTILFKKNNGYIWLPNINQVQEYNLQQKSELVQQFLLLGFGTDTNELKKNYNPKYLGEEDLDDDTTVQLELVPLKGNVTAQIAKIQIWVSEESWLPVQQKFYEAGGDYLIARYSKVGRDLQLPASIFNLNAPSSAKHVQMN